MEAVRDAVSLIGKTLHGFLVRRLLGEGGMGVVYEGYRADLDKRAAIKVLNPDYARDRHHAARFVNEAIGTSRVKQPGFDYMHENVVTVEHVGSDDEGRPFIVYEFLEGCDLDHVIRAHWRTDGAVGTTSEPIASKWAASVLLQVCRALDAAHPRIVHRDLKPANVFITRRPGRDPFVKLLDFGIAKLRSDIRATGVATGAGGIMGTPLYMAPEQAERPMDVDYRADIFALGGLMYHLLTGRTAYPADVDYPAIFAAQRDGILPPPVTHLRPDLDPRWEVIVARCLAYQREGRYPNVRALAQDIAGATPGGPEIFATVWPDYEAKPDDITLPNDGSVLPARSAARSAFTSHSAAAGARSATAATSSRRWMLGAGGAAVVLIAAAVVLGTVGRGGSADDGEPSPDDPGTGYRAADRVSPDAALVAPVDAGVAMRATIDATEATATVSPDAGAPSPVASSVKKEPRRRPRRGDVKPDPTPSKQPVIPAPPVDAGAPEPKPKKKGSKDDLLLGR